MSRQVCAWCERPIAPKGANWDVIFRDQTRAFVHGTCAADVIQGALASRELRREKNRLENGA